MDFYTEATVGQGYLSGIRYFHWVSQNHNEHTILGDFYDSFNEQLDRLAESIYGRGLISKLTNPGVFGAIDLRKYTPKSLVQEMIDRYTHAGTRLTGVSDTPEIENIIAEIVESCSKAMYLLNQT